MRALSAALAALTLFVSCDAVDDLTDLDDEKPKEAPQKALNIKSVRFSPDAKTFTLSVVEVKDLSDIPISNKDSVSVALTEYDTGGKPVPSQPVLEDLVAKGPEEISAAQLYLTVIVDLTLPDRMIEAQKSAVRQIRSVFGDDNMALTFLSGKGYYSSESVADFVLENDFKRDADGANKKLLLKTILGSLQAARDSSATHEGRRDLVLAFSNGKVYNGTRTIDPQHFSTQEDLTQLCSEPNSSVSFYYVNFSPQNTPGEAEYFLKSLCEGTNGSYQNSFSWSKLSEQIFLRYGIDYTDFDIVLRNRDQKLYNGQRSLSIEFTYKDEMVADGLAQYTIGNFYQPVIVNGEPHIQVLLQGLVITVLMLLIAYLIFQYVVPQISYLIFKKKYIRSYTGSNMSVNGVLVGDECYYCKAPFVPGEEIVARCKHVMHRQCWEENGHHCPEYGRNCKEGSHYYNRRKPSDPKNASFLLKWIGAGLIAGFFSWMLFSTLDNSVSVSLLENIMMKIYGLKAGTPEATAFIEQFITHLNQLPSFGLGMGFFLTLFISLLTVHHRNTRRMILEIALRSLCGAAAGYLFFMLGCILSEIVNLGDNGFLVDWVPWSLTGFAIVLIASVGTMVRVRRKWILITIGLGIISMFLWNLIFVSMGTDYRTLLLLSHTIFSVGLALSVAQAFPRSERYFLHVGGSMKEMDIAIYKWFEANTNRVITVGKSVDCDLILSWDVKGDVAPVQADLTKEGDRVFITPLEPGLFVKGKPVAAGKKVHLFHGKHFTIGTTEFTYLEKDV